MMLRESHARAEGRGIWTTCGEQTSVDPAMDIDASQCFDAVNAGVNIRPLTPGGDLDCADIAHRRFVVLPSDPHNLIDDGYGIGCERME